LHQAARVVPPKTYNISNIEETELAVINFQQMFQMPRIADSN